jgi:hypothetical protein
MSYTAQQCFDRAEECDRIASEAKTRDARASFIKLAGEWRELARRKEGAEWNRAKKP